MIDRRWHRNGLRLSWCSCGKTMFMSPIAIEFEVRGLALVYEKRGTCDGCGDDAETHRHGNKEECLSEVRRIRRHVVDALSCVPRSVDGWAHAAQCLADLVVEITSEIATAKAIPGLLTSFEAQLRRAFAAQDPPPRITKSRDKVEIRGTATIRLPKDSVFIQHDRNGRDQ